MSRRSGASDNGVQARGFRAMLEAYARRLAWARRAAALQSKRKQGGTQDVAVERTLVILKPDAVQRGLIGEIIGRLERARVEDRRARHAHDRPRGRGSSLRRARGQAVLRGADRVHHVGSGGVDGARRAERGGGDSLDDGQDESGRGRAGNDPRRPGADDRPQSDPRLGRDRRARSGRSRSFSADRDLPSWERDSDRWVLE